MEERKGQIARRAIDAYNRGDAEAVVTFLAEDVEVFSSPDLPNDGTFHGHAGWRDWMRQWADAWDEQQVEVLEIEPLDDRHALLTVQQFGRGAFSGIELEMVMVMLFEVDDDGKIVRFQLHRDRDAALAQLPSD